MTRLGSRPDIWSGPPASRAALSLAGRHGSSVFLNCFLEGLPSSDALSALAMRSESLRSQRPAAPMGPWTANPNADGLMTTMQPRRVIVLGTSLSGKIASIALADRLEVLNVVGPEPQLFGPDPAELSGKQAHSHAFLPRFIREIDAVAPSLSKSFNDNGLKRSRASRAFFGRAPFSGTHLKAMRWQVDDVITAEFNRSFSDRTVANKVAGARIDGHIYALDMQDGQSLDIDQDTLVVDATGAQSPLMKLISGHPGAPAIEDLPSNIGYVTQLFRLRKGPQGASSSRPGCRLLCQPRTGIRHALRRFRRMVLGYPCVGHQKQDDLRSPARHGKRD